MLSALALAPAVATAATHKAELTLDAGAGARISLENLAGRMTVTGGDGDRLVIEADRVGATDALAQSVTLEHRVDGDSIEIWFEYPDDEIVYRPDDGWSGNTRTSYRGERVEVSSRGDGAEVHVNVRVTLPKGVQFAANNVVGGLEAAGVHGTTTLKTSSGRIKATDGSGEWELRSGSGRISVEGFDGDLDAHTGSGRIALERVSGEIEATTGSGGIEASNVGGDVEMQTGSGGIRISDLMGGGAFEATTGSGSIRVDGDLSKVTDLTMQTGSGSIRVETTGVPNVKLVARTGSGSVDVDVPNMSDVNARRNRVEATLGTGEGTASLRTGSGSIDFSIKD